LGFDVELARLIYGRQTLSQRFETDILLLGETRYYQRHRSERRHHEEFGFVEGGKVQRGPVTLVYVQSGDERRIAHAHFQLLKA